MDDFTEDEFDEKMDPELEASFMERSSNIAQCMDDRFLGLSELPRVMQKTVLKNEGKEYLDPLPDEWIEIQHKSGIPVYLHKPSRVCTFARPYWIGEGSCRNHDMSIGAIPCYFQKKLKELGSVNAKGTDPAAISPNCAIKRKRLDPMQLHDYCSPLFEFETKESLRFTTWKDFNIHKANMKRRKRMDSSEETYLKGSTSTSIANHDAKEHFKNTSTYILQQYVGHILRGQVKFTILPTSNAAIPFRATVLIKQGKQGWVEHGVGEGANKRKAKLIAAKETLHTLVSGIQFNADCILNTKSCEEISKICESIPITDDRVLEYCILLALPTPTEILHKCLKRYAPILGDTTIHVSMKHVPANSNQFTMTIANYEVSVLCSDKKDGERRATQAILKELHQPHFTTWGPLVRWYDQDKAEPDSNMDNDSE